MTYSLAPVCISLISPCVSWLSSIGCLLAKNNHYIILYNSRSIDDTVQDHYLIYWISIDVINDDLVANNYFRNDVTKKLFDESHFNYIYLQTNKMMENERATKPTQDLLAKMPLQILDLSPSFGCI